MADFDSLNVDALLDDALEGKPITDERLARTLNGTAQQEEEKPHRSRSRSRDRDSKRRRSSSRDRRRSSSRDRRRSSSRDRDRGRRRRSRSRDRKRSRSRDRGGYRGGGRDSRGGRRDRSRDRRRSRSRDRPRVLDHRRSPRRSPPPRGGRLPGPERRDVMPFTAKTEPPKGARLDMSAEERDFRTIFVLQLARNTRPRDLEEFFSSVGHVRDVRIITDSRSGRSKGIGYVEFWEEESVSLGLALNGQKLLGAPLVIQRTCAERNRAAAASSTVGTALGFGPTNQKGPVKLNISNLHPNIDEDMLESIFAPFGRVQTCKLNKDNKGTSIGSGHVIFTKSEDGHKAAEQLNGFELAGSNMTIKVVDEEGDSKRPLHEEERTGMISGQAGRAQMMAKLAASSSDVEFPDRDIPSIATQCFVLSNMFDPKKEKDANWEEDIRVDVATECNRHGGSLHIFVDKNSDQGNVYVKCPSVTVAHASVTALHGRWFSGKVITANYVPVSSYHELFPDALIARNPMPAYVDPSSYPVPPMPQGFIPQDFSYR